MGKCNSVAIYYVYLTLKGGSGRLIEVTDLN